MSNVFIVTAVSTKDRNSRNVDIDNVVFIDTDNNKIAYGKYELVHKTNIGNFNIAKRRYENDLVNIEDSVGTLAFINTELKFYGILRQMGTKLVVEWITEDNLKKDKNYNKIANINNRLVDITSLGKEVFNRNWLSVIKQIFVNEVNYKITSKEKFIEDIEGKEEKETPTLNEISEQEETIENTESNKDDTIENIELYIVKRLVEIEKREEAVKLKEKDIQEKSDRLSRLLAKLETVDVEKVVGAVVNVDNIYEFDESPASTLDKSDLANEFALKMSNNGDIIKIDKKYLSKIISLNRKTLESSVANTRYRMMISLKFERMSEYSIFGIIDCIEENDYVTFKVLKAYSNQGITENEISKFHLDYLKERKQRYTT